MPSWFHVQQKQNPHYPQPLAHPKPPPPPPSSPSRNSADDAVSAYLFATDDPSQTHRATLLSANATRATTMPMMEEPVPVGLGMAAGAHDDHIRPSILEFRSSRFSRVNPQRAQMLAAMAHAVKPHMMDATSEDGDGSEDGCENYGDHRNTMKKRSAANGRDSDRASRTSSTRTTEKTNADEDEETDDPDGEDEFGIYENGDYFDVTGGMDGGGLNDADESADEGSEFFYGDDDDLLTCVMSMPFSAEIPLLEGANEDEVDHDVDAILCDPSRLPRTMVVDEHGFQLSRESLLMSASRLNRGSPTAPLKTGLLFKQGFGLLSSGGWKVRHVVLTSAKIMFFREEQGRKRGEIDLAQCSPKSVEIMPRDSVYDGKHATVWRFAVRGKGGRRVLLAAYSEAEMKDWLRALHVALAVQSGAGMGRFTDFGVVPSGTFLADKNDGQLRSSANFR